MSASKLTKSQSGRDILACDLSKTFNSPEYSDLIVKCQDESFYCHQVIVRNRSKFFDAACRHDKTSSGTIVIDINEEEPKSVSSVLRFLYAGSLEKDEVLWGDDTESLMAKKKHSFRLYGLAEKLALPEFKSHVCDWMSTNERLSPTKFNVRDLKDLIQIAYSSTPEWYRGLRDRILSYISSFGKFAWNDEIGKLLVDQPEFSADLVKAYMGTFQITLEPCRLKCEDCKAEFSLLKTSERICYYCGKSSTK